MKDESRKHVRQAASAKWRLQGPGNDWCFGVCSLEADYDAPIESCVAALGDACRRLGLEVVAGDVRAEEARIDARSSDLSELVRITVRTGDNGTRRVSFSVGREWTQDIRQLISGLREAFECGLRDR